MTDNAGIISITACLIWSGSSCSSRSSADSKRNHSLFHAGFRDFLRINNKMETVKWTCGKINWAHIGVNRSKKLDLDPPFRSRLKKWSRSHSSRSFLVGSFYYYIDPYLDPDPDLFAVLSKRSFNKKGSRSTVPDPKFAAGSGLFDTPFRSLTPMWAQLVTEGNWLWMVALM